MRPSLRIGRGALLSGLAFAALVLCPTSLAAQQIIEFPIPTATGSPLNIVTGPDGNLWFTDAAPYLGNLGRITVSGTFTEFPIPSEPYAPDAIAAGPDGNLWYTRACVAPRTSVVLGVVGRMTTEGTSEEFPANGGPVRITAGPDGNLWFTETFAGKIGRITPTGVITEYSIPTANSSPWGIVAGPDGDLWFTEGASGKIGRITPTGTVVEFPLLSANRHPGNITVGPNTDFWFTESDLNGGNWIARMTLSGSVTEFEVPTPGALTITTGSDGNLWFTEFTSGKIGRITPAGSITEFGVPTTDSGPWGITSGPDGNVWFAESGGKEIGRVTLSACTSAPTDLCLGSGRFRTSVVWSTQGDASAGNPHSITSNTGAFWFFDPTNLELVVKVLDGREINGKFWVFYGSLTNVEFTLTVTDTHTGAVKTYMNPQGQLASVADTSAF